MADPDGTATAPSGDIPLWVYQQIAMKGINPYSPEGEKMVQELWASTQANQEALKKIAAIIPPGYQQLDETHFYNPGNGRVYEIGGAGTGTPKLVQYTATDSKSFLDEYVAGGSGGSGGGSTARLASDDPRYWQNLDRQFQLELAKLGLDAQNIGLDSEAARMQVLGSLIANRNNTAVDVANVAAQVAKQVAEFAANPRDTYAEAIYRNQVGGSVPMGDIQNKHFDTYQKALADKVGSIFQPVAADLNQARTYRDSIPPLDVFGPETRQQLNLAPTPAQQLTGVGASGAPAPAAPAPDNSQLAGALQFLQAMENPETADAFRKWTTSDLPKMDMGGVVKARTGVGDAPTSTEGGLNLNLFEPAMVVGMDSGKVYATLAEPRPDGTRRGEQLVVKPLKSEVEKDKKLAEGQKAITQSFGVPKAASGGSINATPDEMYEQFNMLLQRLGGAGGGTTTPFGGARHLAGAPANEIMADPFLKDITEATYSQKGVRPEQLWADIAKFMPKSPINNSPRVSFL